MNSAAYVDEQIKTLDLEPYIQFKRSEPVAVDEGFEIPIDEKLQDMLQSYDVEVAYYDDEGRLINYGRDELARLDGEGKLVCEFDGTWICLDGVPLATELVSSTGNSVEYRSKVSYNGKELQAKIVDGTTYAPVRVLAESLGLKVIYDSKTKKTTITR